MTSTTFRVESDTIERLKAISDRENVSLNVVVGRILRQAADFAEVAERLGIVGFARSELLQVMEYLTDEEAEKWGRHAGGTSGSFREFVLGYFGRDNLDGFFKTVELAEQYARNFKISRSVDRDGSISLILHHSWGRKWSLYYYGALDERLKALTESGHVKSHLVKYTDNQAIVTIMPENSSKIRTTDIMPSTSK